MTKSHCGSFEEVSENLGHFGSLLFSPAQSDGRIRKQNAAVELEVPLVLSDGGLGCITVQGVWWFQLGRHSLGMSISLVLGSSEPTFMSTLCPLNNQGKEESTREQG